MANEDQQRSSRVVVETPTARREVVRTETEHTPERRGFSTGAVAAMVIAAVALVTILFLFLINRQDQANMNNSNLTVTQPPAQQPQQQPIVVQQPAQQPPIVVQQPASQAPVVIQAPPASSSDAARASGTDDWSIQTAIDKKISEDTTLASLGITAVVIDGKVTLNGTVRSEELKARVERLVKSVKGARSIDNQIIVTAGM